MFYHALKYIYLFQLCALRSLKKQFLFAIDGLFYMYRNKYVYVYVGCNYKIIPRPLLNLLLNAEFLRQL